MASSLADLQDLTAPQQAILEGMAAQPLLTQTFYLTGGTLLKARGIVPRESNDLDFFTFASVDSLTYSQRLVTFKEMLVATLGPSDIIPTDRGFQHRTSGMVVDIVADSVANIDAFVSFGRLQTASLKDLAAHKASALCSRDEVKDYLDIAFLTRHHHWLLKDLATFAEQKFGLGTISEEKLLTELIAKRDSFSIPPAIWLRDPAPNMQLVVDQIAYLIEHTTL